MALGAGLPPELWPESSMAAIYLYNMDSLLRWNWKSFNIVLEEWFRGYFRWYDPALVSKLITDLRPDFSGFYAYGVRAYLMVKDREVLRNRRGFKVAARGYIGYLVGYIATNIYRIWVPLLYRVIVFRNVTFDELIFYIKESENVMRQPLSIVKNIVELIGEEEGLFQDVGLDIFNDVMEEESMEAESSNAADVGGE